MDRNRKGTYLVDIHSICTEGGVTLTALTGMTAESKFTLECYNMLNNLAKLWSCSEWTQWSKEQLDSRPSEVGSWAASMGPGNILYADKGTDPIEGTAAAKLML